MRADWAAVWDCLKPHDGFDEEDCRCAIEECEHALQMARWDVEQHRQRANHIAEMEHFLKCAALVQKRLGHTFSRWLLSEKSWEEVDGWYQMGSAFPQSDGKLSFDYECAERITADLDRVLTTASDHIEALKQEPSLPPRHSIELDQYWTALLGIWRWKLGRKIDESQRLIAFLTAAARPLAGANRATPDAARRFLRVARHRNRPLEDPEFCASVSQRGLDWDPLIGWYW